MVAICSLQRKEKNKMKENKFIEGTIIKRKDLKGYTLCKILSEDMNMRVSNIRLA